MSVYQQARQRRRRLHVWLRAQAIGRDFTASDIVKQSDIYKGPGRYDRCFDDLKALASSGKVTRLPGRPARWFS